MSNGDNPMTRPTIGDLLHPIIDAAREVWSNADDTGCTADLIVTSKAAVHRLQGLLQSPYPLPSVVHAIVHRLRQGHERKAGQLPPAVPWRHRGVQGIKGRPNHMKIDNAFFHLLRADLATALKPLEDRLGVKFDLGNGTYNREGTNGSLKLTFGVVSEDGNVETKEAADFKRMAPLYGMKADDLGREFGANGKRYRITGWRVKAPTRPIIAARVDSDKEFVFPSRDVKLFLEREEKKAAGK